jgi:O-antigen/teichoic acid export membrane protein
MARQRNRGVVLAAAAGLSQRLAQLAAALVTLPLVLHALGVAGFGIWGAAVSLAWAAGMLDLGLGGGLVTLLPERFAAGRGDEAAALVGGAMLGALGLGAALAVAGCVLVMAFVGAGARDPFLLAVLGLAVNLPLGLAGSIWFGLQKGFWAGFWELAQTLLTLAFLLLAAALHGGVLAMVGAVFGGMVLANAASLAHLFWSQPRLRPVPWARPIALGIVWRQGGWLFATTVAVSCLYMFDNLLALHWLGAAASAQMTIALRLCTTAAGMIGVATQPLWPAFVDAAAMQDFAWARRVLNWGSLAVAALAAGGALAIGLLGAPVLRWWLHADIMAPDLLWACGAWILATCATRVPALLLNAFSILRFQAATFLATLAAATLLKALLAPAFGVTGILTATALASIAITWPAYAWRLSRV